MRTKFFTLTLVLLTILNANTQSLSDARKAFDKYEYKTAAEYFDHLIQDDKKLELEDLKRITYSYYILGAYKKCKPYSDSLLSYSKVEDLFYLINGDVNKGLSLFSNAIESYEKYQSMGGEEEVTLKIEACKMIPTWENETYVSFNENSQNTVFADFIGGTSSNGTVYFSEKGFNKNDIEVNVKSEDTKNVELLLSSPYLKSGDHYNNIKLKDAKHASITSLSFMPNKVKAIISVSYPLEKDDLLKAPNLYWVTYDSLKNELYDLQPFEYSGLSDTSSTAHATINASGNKMVFSKIKSKGAKADLYYTELNNDKWSTPKPLSNINTQQNELYPLFSGDSILIFSSDGRVGYGDLDIYSAFFDGVETNKITHLKAPINSVRDDFNLIYLSQDSALFASNRSGGSGDDDIYSIRLKKKEEKAPVDTIDTTDQIVEWNTKSIYFKFDNFKLEDGVTGKEIEDLKTILNTNESCKIHLLGFTDSRGTSEYNKVLGMERAKSVEKALIETGINASSMVLKSMGEKNQPNACGSECSEEDHELNRVVQIELKCK